MCVNNLPRVARGSRDLNPVTCWLQVQLSNHSATEPHSSVFSQLNEKRMLSLLWIQIRVYLRNSYYCGYDDELSPLNPGWVSTGAVADYEVTPQVQILGGSLCKLVPLSTDIASLGIFQSVKVKSIQCKPTVQQDGKTRGFGFHGIGKKCGFGFGSVTVPPLLIIVVYYAKGVTNTHTIFLNIKIA